MVVCGHASLGSQESSVDVGTMVDGTVHGELTSSSASRDRVKSTALGGCCLFRRAPHHRSPSQRHERSGKKSLSGLRILLGTRATIGLHREGLPPRVPALQSQHRQHLCQSLGFGASIDCVCSTSDATSTTTCTLGTVDAWCGAKTGPCMGWSARGTRTGWPLTLASRVGQVPHRVHLYKQRIQDHAPAASISSSFLFPLPDSTSHIGHLTVL